MINSAVSASEHTEKVNSCVNFTCKFPIQDGLICLFILSFIWFFSEDVNRKHGVELLDSNNNNELENVLKEAAME